MELNLDNLWSMIYFDLQRIYATKKHREITGRLKSGITEENMAAVQKLIKEDILIIYDEIQKVLCISRR